MLALATNRAGRVLSLRSTWGLLVVGTVLGVWTGNPPTTQATDFTWNTTNGNWNNSISWLPFGFPQVGDRAFFSTDATFNVEIEASASGGSAADRVEVNTGTVTFQQVNPFAIGELNVLTGAGAFYALGGNVNFGGTTTGILVSIADELRIQSGSQTNIRSGTDVKTGRLNLGQLGGNGFLTVTDVNSSLGVSGTSILGQNGHEGVLRVENGATAQLVGTTRLGFSSVSGSTGILVVDGGPDGTGSVTTGQLFVGGGSNSGASGFVSVLAGELTSNGSVTVGGVPGRGSGSFDVGTNAVFNSGTAAVEVRSTGAWNNDGEVNLGGDFTVDGGNYIEIFGGSGVTTFAPGSTVSVLNGGHVELNTHDFIVPNGGLFDIAGSTSQLLLRPGLNSIGAPFQATEDTTITIRDGATVHTNTARLGVGADHVTATLNLLNGGKLNLGSNGLLLDQHSTGTNRVSEINIQGSGSGLTVNSSFSTLQLGHPSGTGTQVQMNVSGNGFVDLLNNTRLEVNPQGTLSFDNGSAIVAGDITIRGGTVNTSPGSFGVINNPSFLNRTFRIEEGGSVNLAAYIFEVAGNRLEIDGPGSQMTIATLSPSEPSLIAMFSDSGTPASIQVTNLGSLSVAQFNAASLSSSGSSLVQVDVLSGGTIQTGHLGVGTLVYEINSNLEIFGVTPAELNIDGPGSRVVMDSGDFVAHVGSAELWASELQTATVNLTAGGELDTSEGTLFINRLGIINVDGGVLRASEVHKHSNGKINFLSGTIVLDSPLVVANAQLLGPTIQLTNGKHLELSGMLEIQPVGTVSLQGGSLSTRGIGGNGNFAFHAGKLEITGPSGLDIGAGGPLPGNVLLLDSSKQLQVTHTATIQGGTTVGVQNGGIFLAQTIDNHGELLLDGSLAEVEANLDNRNLLRGNGRVRGSLVNHAGAEVRLNLGNRLVFDGGTSHANAGKLMLVGGEAEFKQPLTNQPTGNITGRGTLITPGLTNQGDLAFSSGVTDIYGDVENATGGRVSISGNSSVTFWDDVSHSGTLFNVQTGSSATFFGTAGFSISGGGDVYFEADITPGTSPGLETFGGNVHIGALANLEIELAGTTKGSQYDALQIAGLSTLGGTLEVVLLDDFSPQPGDLFEVLRAESGIFGEFAHVSLPPLALNYEWNVMYSGSSVLLEVQPGIPGDFNFDGQVDGDDLVVWEQAFGETAAGDADGDGISDGFDFLTWQQNFGMGIAPLAASQVVPEPSSWLLVMLAIALVGRGNRRFAV